MRYVAFLRGINVSGQKLIKMEELRKHFEMPGFKNIVSYIQSGNVLFDTKKTDEELLRKKIEKQLALKLSYDVPTIVRSVDDIKKAIKDNPFNDIAPDDKRKLYVTFLSAAPHESLHGALELYKNELEEARLLDREVYMLSTSYADTKLSNTLIERKFKVTGTTRNWATVNKILEL